MRFAKSHSRIHPQRSAFAVLSHPLRLLVRPAACTPCSPRLAPPHPRRRSPLKRRRHGRSSMAGRRRIRSARSGRCISSIGRRAIASRRRVIASGSRRSSRRRARFYAREMERNGFGPRTIRLVKEADGLCRIHLVRGAEPYANYEVEKREQDSAASACRCCARRGSIRRRRRS